MTSHSPLSSKNSAGHNNTGISQTVYEELIAWSVKLNSGLTSADDRQQFLEWCAQDVTHEAAWQELYAAEQNLGALATDSKQIVADTFTLLDVKRNTLATRRRTLKLLSVATFSIIGTALLVNQFAPWQQQAYYATNVGKRDSIMLADGTKLMLNTNSKVAVKFSLLKREIVLHSGEIYIETSKDSDSIIGRRSFWVKTEQAELEAIGTRFSVNQQASNTKLHVAQGIVAMHVDKYAPVRAYANETYTMHDTVSAPVKNSADNHLSMDPIGWIDGVLVAKQMRLDEFVAELSRYQELPLMCEPTAGDLTVSGVFQLSGSDPIEHALKAIARTLPVRITKQVDAIVISKK